MNTEFTDLVIEEFARNANPKEAIPMKKYMKGKFEYFGIKSPVRKEISRIFLSKENLPTLEEVPDIIRELWDQPQRELQYFALELLNKFDKRAPENWIDLYEELITAKSWWDTVDGLAAWQVGSHFRKYPKLIGDSTSKWMKSGNIWLQRTCLIFQLKYKEQTDFELMKSFILPLTSSKEFFIQKAIGWALRQYSKFNPDEVMEFAQDQPMVKLSYREATRIIFKNQLI